MERIEGLNIDIESLLTEIQQQEQTIDLLRKEVSDNQDSITAHNEDLLIYLTELDEYIVEKPFKWDSNSSAYADYLKYNDSLQYRSNIEQCELSYTQLFLMDTKAENSIVTDAAQRLKLKISTKKYINSFFDFCPYYIKVNESFLKKELKSLMEIVRE
jgi:hypothetical protein